MPNHRNELATLIEVLKWISARLIGAQLPIPAVSLVMIPFDTYGVLFETDLYGCLHHRVCDIIVISSSYTPQSSSRENSPKYLHLSWLSDGQHLSTRHGAFACHQLTEKNNPYDIEDAWNISLVEQCENTIPNSSLTLSLIVSVFDLS